MRLLLESSTYRFVPSEATSPGLVRLCAVGVAGMSDDVKSACPMTTSAGAPLLVGILFQIRTRSLPPSATTSSVPSLQIPSGSRSPVSVVAALELLKLGWPTTTSAGAPLVVGMLFQMRIRLLLRSATNSLPATTNNPFSGRFNPDCVVAPALEVKFGWPTTRSAGLLVLVGRWFQMS